jgi:hypothetical protein
MSLSPSSSIITSTPYHPSILIHHAISHSAAINYELSSDITPMSLYSSSITYVRCLANVTYSKSITSFALCLFYPYHTQNIFFY